jgi:hypothetical protein
MIRWKYSALLLGSLAALILTAALMARSIAEVRDRIQSGSDSGGINSPDFEHSLDRPMLMLELPQRESEFRLLAPPEARPFWVDAIRWDCGFVFAYVLFLPLLVFGLGNDERLELITRLAIATGIADWVENGTQLLVLSYLDEGQRLTGTRAFTVLPIFAALKWLLFFLTCRAIALEFSVFRGLRWIAVLLRAFLTAGMWATLFAFAGLPARAPLGLMATLTAILLLCTAGVRLLKRSETTHDDVVIPTARATEIRAQ